MPCFKSCTYLCLTFCLFMANAPLLADEDSFQRQPGGHQVHYLDSRGLPVNELLNLDELKTYNAALVENNCDAAYTLLTNAYALAFPKDPPSRFKCMDNDRLGRLCCARDHYPELVICEDQRQIRDARTHIEREGISLERISENRLMTSQTKPWPIFEFGSALRYLILLAKRPYGPAILALVKLSEEGEVIRFTREFQYYAVLRTHTLAVNTAELEELTELAAGRIDLETRLEIKRQADKARFSYSNLWLE